MINAVLSSTVYKTNDDLYEILSLDMRYSDAQTESPFVQFAFLQQVEIQAVGYDDNDKFILEPDDWHIKSNMHHPNQTRSGINTAIDELCNLAKTKYNARLCGTMSHVCVMVRNSLDCSFSEEFVVNGIDQEKNFTLFHDELLKRMHPDVLDLMLEYFSCEFPDIRKLANSTKHLRSVKPKEPQKPSNQQYAEWGAW